MSRKPRPKKQPKQAVPEEILAEGSGPLADVAPTPVAELAAAAEGIGITGEPVDTQAAESAEVADAAEAAESAEVADAAEAADVVDVVVAAASEAAAADDPASAEAAPPGEAPSADALEELTEEEAAELGATLPTSAASMDTLQLKYLVEALVFAADKPITIQRLRQLTRVSDTRRLEHALSELAVDYKERGIALQQVSGGYQFRTATQFSTWVQQLIAGRPVRLSRAQLETLAIIAYRQPITRPEIDEIRGVDSSATLKLLLDRSLIRILGKKEEVGRPMLYGTTKEFLDFFSLGDLRELPTLREYSELTDESRRVMSDELGLDPDAPDTPDDDDNNNNSGSGTGGDDDGGSGGGSMDADASSASTEPASLDELIASYTSSIADEPDAPDETSTLDALAARRLASPDGTRIDAPDQAEVAAADAAAADIADVATDDRTAAAVSAADVDTTDVADADMAAANVDAADVDGDDMTAAATDVARFAAADDDAADDAAVDADAVEADAADEAAVDMAAVDDAAADVGAADVTSVVAAADDSSDAPAGDAASLDFADVRSASVADDAVEVPGEQPDAAAHLEGADDPTGDDDADEVDVPVDALIVADEVSATRAPDRGSSTE